MLAYLSNDGLDIHLYTQNLDGTNQQQLTTLPVTGFYPLKASYCWSPASDALLYMNGNRLYKINADGSGLALIVETTDNQSFTEVGWASNGDISARTEVTTMPPFFFL